MQDYLKVAVLGSIFEAQRLEAILTEKKILHIIESYHDSAYDGLFQSHRGWGSIKAPAQYSAPIKEILQDLRSDQP